ncbi:DUF5994 family protein [Streptomyces flavofungini]|uniref:Uncharacterized protein n=1 Tax=Streptomyces flavofungini TaxID=68200 RepID=A0ABS0WXG9_9ACTN|nr:DUF5994 family protein [Streptomyces flavofungini]MBJ3805634.1 hypothetical protein [Streptomyces flavofungini]GHC72707.1 hypothetical protein GCM10010349_49860 [Streptomyces flavofungini]
MNAPIVRRSSAAPGRPATYPPARLALRPPTFPPGPVCGAWWPRTDDLAAELASLTDVFDDSHGLVTRIASHRGSWPREPRTLPVTGHTVTAIWYTSGLDPHTIRLFSCGARRWDLLVVPPRSEADAAARLMTAAADPALHLTGTDLMAAEGPSG